MPPRAMPATTVSSASTPAASLNSVNWPMARTVSADQAKTRIAASTVQRNSGPAPSRSSRRHAATANSGAAAGAASSPRPSAATPSATSAIAGLTCQRLSARPPATAAAASPPSRSAPTPTATADAAVAPIAASSAAMRGRPVCRCSTHATSAAPPSDDGGPVRAVRERGRGEDERRGEQQRRRPVGAPAHRPRRTGGGATEQDDSGELGRHVRAILSASATRNATLRELRGARGDRQGAGAGSRAGARRAAGVPHRRGGGARAGAHGRARDRQDDAVGGGRRPRPRRGPPRPARPAQRRRGGAVVRGADRPLRAARRGRAGGPARAAAARARGRAPPRRAGRGGGAAGDRARPAQRAARRAPPTPRCSSRSTTCSGSTRRPPTRSRSPRGACARTR